MRSGQINGERETVPYVASAGEHLPFILIILLVWMIPFTRVIVGNVYRSAGGYYCSTDRGAAPFIARMVENALLEIPTGLIEAFTRYWAQRDADRPQSPAPGSTARSERGNHQPFITLRLFPQWVAQLALAV